MIAECRRLIEDALKTAQVPRVYHDLDALGRRNVLPFAVLLLDRETVRRDGSRVATSDEADGRTRVYRRRIYAREVPVTVVIAHHDEARAEAVLAQVLLDTARGFTDAAGNHHRVRVDAVKWLEEASAVRKRATVEADLSFSGGVYRDDRVPLVTDVAPEPDTEE